MGIDNFRVTESFAREFEEKCQRARSHDFVRFLTRPNEKGNSILRLIATVEDEINLKPVYPDRKIVLDKQIILSYMKEFFSLYLPKKADEAMKILSGEHPYFKDENGESHVNFITAENGAGKSGNVGHYGRQDFLEFNVYIHNLVSDLRVVVHETSHGLSGHHQHLIELIRENSPENEVEGYVRGRGRFDKDCVGEIESHIVERLFNRFLVQKGVYTKEDMTNYDNMEKNSLMSEINLIREEKDIIEKLPQPVTFDSLDNLVSDLQKSGNMRLVERVRKMHDEKKHGSYMFRYVVGRIVADQWIKAFDSADVKTQTEMLDRFQDYLGQTDKINLEDATKMLLGKSAEQVVLGYAHDRESEKNINK